MKTQYNNQLKDLLPLIYIHINRTVKKAVKEAIAELNQQETLNARDCSEYLCIGIDKLYRMVRNGEIRHNRVGKRKLIFKKEDLDNYLLNKIIKKDE